METWGRWKNNLIKLHYLLQVDLQNATGIRCGVKPIFKHWLPMPKDDLAPKPRATRARAPLLQIHIFTCQQLLHRKVGDGGGFTVLLVHWQESKQLFKEISGKVKIWCLGRVVVPRFRESQTFSKKTNGSNKQILYELLVEGAWGYVPRVWWHRCWTLTELLYESPFIQWYIKSGQIIATSHDLTPKGSWGREIPLFQGNLGWWNIIIWPDSMNILEIAHCEAGDDRMDMDVMGCNNIPWHW